MESGQEGGCRLATAACWNLQKDDNLMEAQIILSLLPVRRKVMRWDKVELGVAIVCTSSSVGLSAHLPLN